METYVSKTPPSADCVTKPGVEREKLASVMDAMRADLSTVLLELVVALRSLHSLPLDDVPVCTTAMEPGLSTYSDFEPLRVQRPPLRPSVKGSKEAASHASCPLSALTSEHCAVHEVSLSTVIGLPIRSSVMTWVLHNTR